VSQQELQLANLVSRFDEARQIITPKVNLTANLGRKPFELLDRRWEMSEPKTRWIVHFQEQQTPLRMAAARIEPIKPAFPARANSPFSSDG